MEKILFVQCFVLICSWVSLHPNTLFSDFVARKIGGYEKTLNIILGSQCALCLMSGIIMLLIH